MTKQEKNKVQSHEKMFIMLFWLLPNMATAADTMQQKWFQNNC